MEYPRDEMARPTRVPRGWKSTTSISQERSWGCCGQGDDSELGQVRLDLPVFFVTVDPGDLSARSGV